MARPQKATVDYFPLDCQFSDSIKCIKSEFGNNGELFWVRLLQTLGRHEYHYIDLRPSNKTYLLFYSEDVGFDVTLSNQILNKLSEYGCIDHDLYKLGIVYSEKFVKNIEDAYRKRNVKPKSKQELLEEVSGGNKVEEIAFFPPETSISGGSYPQIKENKSKENEIKVNLSLNKNKISDEEREILNRYVTKHNLAQKSVVGYVNKLIENGDYIDILNEETAKLKKEDKANIDEDIKQVKDELSAIRFIAKYGDQLSDVQLPQVEKIMNEYGFESINDVAKASHGKK